MAVASTGQRTASWHLRYWLPVVAYLGLIFFLSAQPHLQPPLHFANADKTMHMGEYAVLGWLLARALAASLPTRGPLFVSLLAIALGAAWGASDEFHQSFVPGRDCSFYDWCADSMGLTLAQLARTRFSASREG